MERYSIYLLHLYKSTHFICFTGTKVPSLLALLVQKYPLYLISWNKSTNTDAAAAQSAWSSASRKTSRRYCCTQFTCFTSICCTQFTCFTSICCTQFTCCTSICCTQFTLLYYYRAGTVALSLLCFTSTKVQILTLWRRALQTAWLEVALVGRSVSDPSQVA